jgi:putative ABC transport system permease protein
MAKLFNVPRNMIRLAIADIIYEWRMSVCLLLSVAAIATPLLLFFGLKAGAIETLRHRLLQDPVNLEIMPRVDRKLDKEWFDVWRQDPRVAFVVAHTRKLSAQAELLRPGNPDVRRVNLHPSAFGDLLLKMFGIVPPKNDELILAYPVAEHLGVVAGDKVVMRVSRERGNSKGEHEFTVSAVLPAQATALQNVYLPLEQLEFFENFKDGYAVPEFGWPGITPIAYASYKSLLIFLPRHLAADREALLLQNTGFATLKLLSQQQVQAILPWHQSEDTAYLLQTVGGGASMDNLKAVRERLRGYDAVLVPLGSDLRLQMSGKSFKLLPAAAWGAQLPELQLGDAGSLKDFDNPEADLQPLALINPEDRRDMENLPHGMVLVRITIQNGDSEQFLDYRLHMVTSTAVPQGTLLMPQFLLGRLNLLEQRPLLTDEHGALLLAKRGYSSFRMYASSLEQVAPLAKALEADGVFVDTRADRIAMVQRLDHYLGLLFWLIALASMAGGLACLLSNIYASIERKRRELAVLRLLGAPGIALIIFPLVESATLTLAGLALSVAIFHVLGQVINHMANDLLLPGEHLCRLSIEQHGLALLLGLSMSTAAGLAAARRLLSIDPAESLRDE